MDINMLIGSFFILLTLHYIFNYFESANKQVSVANNCTTQTTGTIISYSEKVYLGMYLPIVSYAVYGKKYTVSGPTFKRITKSIHFSKKGALIQNSSLSFNTNINKEELLPQTLIVNLTHDIDSSNFSNLLKKIYTIGEKVPVFYNPNDPNEAFVIRPLEGRHSDMVIGNLILAFLCIIFAVFFFYVQPI